MAKRRSAGRTWTGSSGRERPLPRPFELVELHRGVQGSGAGRPRQSTAGKLSRQLLRYVVRPVTRPVLRLQSKGRRIFRVASVIAGERPEKMLCARREARREVQTISFTEVLQTAPTTSGNEAGVADLKGHGIAGMRSRRYRRQFEEHGIMISLLSVRPKAIYSGGIHRMWSKTTKEDYWQRELEHIGQQEVLNKELYANGASPTGVFGYGDRYSEYRSHPSDVVADFRSTLNDWHFARVFAAQQTLNSAFVQCTPPETPFAANSADVLWLMIRHSIQAKRLVAQPGIGRIL